MNSDKAKYYVESTVYGLSRVFGKASVGIPLAVVMTISGGYLGYDKTESLENDTVTTDNSLNILANLSYEMDGVEIEKASGDVESFHSMAKELITTTLLNDDLSEQQRQDFLFKLDKDIVDVSDVGFGYLERFHSNDEIVDLSHIRECKLEIESHESLHMLGDFDKAVEIASCNQDKTSNSSLAAIFLSLLFGGGTLGASLGLSAAGVNRRKPKKPLEYGIH